MWIVAVKAVHLIAIVAWFSGLFYLGRLFVYHREAFDRPENEKRILSDQFQIMERRLYLGITWPAMVIAAITGLLLFFAQLDVLGKAPWAHMKLTLAFLLIGYHFWCGAVRKKLAKGESRWASRGFRLFNEIPTFFLVTIVPLAILKSAIRYEWLGGTIVVLAILVVLTVNRSAPAQPVSEAGSEG